MARFCPRFPLPALLLRKHKRQNNVVQHVHPRWLDFESRFLFLGDMVGAVELSDQRLPLIRGDQLELVVQSQGYS